MWWAWSPEARQLFIRIDADLFEEVPRQPHRAALAGAGQARLDELAQDDAFVAAPRGLERTLWRSIISREGWFKKTLSREPATGEDRLLLHGVRLARVAAHLLRRSRRPRRRPPEDGERPRVCPWWGSGWPTPKVTSARCSTDDGLASRALPDQRLAPPAGAAGVRSSSGTRLIVHVAYPASAPSTCSCGGCRWGACRCTCSWTRTSKQNTPADRAITGPLYGGDQEFRVRQEIMLGIGGMYALEVDGASPPRCAT